MIKKKLLIITVIILLLLPTMAQGAGMNVRIQGDRLYWDPSDVSHSYYNVYSNGNLTSPAHEWNGTSYERYIGGLPNGAKIMVCAMMQTSQVDCETVTYNKGGGGGGEEPQTYTVTTGLNGDLLSWNVEPKTGAYQVSIKKDNQHKAYMGLSGQVDLHQFGSGVYKVEVEAMDGKVLGVSDTVNYTSSGGGDNPPPNEGEVVFQAYINDGVITWNIPSGTVYDRVRIYKDGVYIMDTTGQSVDLCGRGYGAGTYQVVPVDGRTSPVTIAGRSNNLSFDGNCGSPTDPPDPTNPSECAVCDKLDALLQCPEWDVYMGDITNAIRRALPPPPDWDDVARTFTNRIAPAVAQQILNVTPQMADIFAERWGDEFDERMGVAPRVPSKAELSNQLDLPGNSLDTRVPDAEDLTPQMPFRGKQSFDLSDAPVIEIKDESKPFILSDPMENIDAPPVGEVIKPNDPNNHTGGMKQPDTIETIMPTPESQLPPSNDPMPTPTPREPDQPPVPNQPNDEPIPMPETGESFEEKKYYKDRP